MTPDALTLEPELDALAGGDPNAVALLAGAVEQLSGAELETHLLTYAQPALFRGGFNAAYINASLVETYVAMLRTWDNDPAEFVHVHGSGWQRDQLVAEVFRHLAPLLTGCQPCEWCLRYGSLSSVGAVGIEGECDRPHGERMAA